MAAGLLIDTDGTVTAVDVPATKIASHLGCRTIDVVALTDRLDLWLDDEGLFTQEFNPVATALARRYGFVWQPYHGRALLCTTTNEGDSCNLTTEQLHAVLATLEDL